MKALLCGGPLDGQIIDITATQESVAVPSVASTLRNGEPNAAVWDPDGVAMGHMTAWNLHGIEPPPEHDRRQVVSELEYRRTERTTSDGLLIFDLK